MGVKALEFLGRLFVLLAAVAGGAFLWLETHHFPWLYAPLAVLIAVLLLFDIVVAQASRLEEKK